MFLLGVIYLLLAIDVQWFNWGTPLTRIAKVTSSLIYVSPGLFFAEAFYYWRARKTNVFRSLSWSHVIISAVVLFTYLTCEWAFSNRDLFAEGSNIKTFVLSLYFVQSVVCWFLMVAAHFLFLVVLIKVQLRVERLKTTVRNDSGNILDDILT
jgi:hypothetical protein